MDIYTEDEFYRRLCNILDDLASDLIRHRELYEDLPTEVIEVEFENAKREAKP